MRRALLEPLHHHGFLPGGPEARDRLFEQFEAVALRLVPLELPQAEFQDAVRAPQRRVQALQAGGHLLLPRLPTGRIFRRC